ncbi:MAG TPA: glycosyltransferase [Solirubrobacteraceae bacterium]|jgi:hypothetical protein
MGRRESAILDVAAARGHDTALASDGAAGSGPGDVLFLIGTANYFPATFRRLARLRPEERPFVLLWHGEPLPAPRVSGLRPARRHARELVKIALRDPRTTDPKSNFRRLRQVLRAGLLDLVVVSTPWRQTFLAEQGIEAEWVPFGSFAPMGHDLGLQRDIDVMFFGAQDVPRRRRIVERMRREGIHVRSEGQWGPKGLWGDERTEVLNRTKIVLNLGRHPGELSGMRLLTAMVCGACVLSESIWDPRPFVPGVHYVDAPVEDLASAAAALLADDERREMIAAAGHAFALAHPLSESVARIIGLAEARAGRPATPRAAGR